MCGQQAPARSLRPSTEVATKRNTLSGQNWPGWPKLTAPWSSDDNELVLAVFVFLVSLPLEAYLLSSAIRGFKDIWSR